jgi:hypothetical protein
MNDTSDPAGSDGKPKRKPALILPEGLKVTRNGPPPGAGKGGGRPDRHNPHGGKPRGPHAERKGPLRQP